MWKANISSRTVSTLAALSFLSVLSLLIHYCTLREAIANIQHNHPMTRADSHRTVQHLPLLTINLNVGRLGNFMFKYASLLGVARSVGRQPIVFPGTDLDRIFQISNLAEYDQEEFENGNWSWMEERHFAKFDAGLLEKLSETGSRSNVSIRGYFQSWKYFQNVTDELRQEFTFRNFIRRDAGLFLQQLRQKTSNNGILIGVHVRRGDYLEYHAGKQGYTVPHVTYYKKAFHWMRRRFAKRPVIFLVASQDLEWCQQHLAAKDVVFMPSASPGHHLFLLASCDHVIMSVGTFGWWGAWLANGLVIYYRDFPKNSSALALHFTSADYFPPQWIGMGD